MSYSQGCIIKEFVEAALLAYSHDDYNHVPRHFVDAAWANGKTSSRRHEVRRERAAARPPCPHCGAPVERVGTSAKLPKYCAPKCMRAARFARWHAKHGAKRNTARRKTGRASPHKGVSPAAPGGDNEGKGNG